MMATAITYSHADAIAHLIAYGYTLRFAERVVDAAEHDGEQTTSNTLLVVAHQLGNAL